MIQEYEEKSKLRRASFGEGGNVMSGIEEQLQE